MTRSGNHSPCSKQQAAGAVVSMPGFSAGSAAYALCELGSYTTLVPSHGVLLSSE